MLGTNTPALDKLFHRELLQMVGADLIHYCDQWYMLYVFAILKHGKSFVQIQTYFSSSSSWTRKKLLARGPETVTHQIGPPVHLISCLTTSQQTPPFQTLSMGSLPYGFRKSTWLPYMVLWLNHIVLWLLCHTGVVLEKQNRSGKSCIGTTNSFAGRTQLFVFFRRILDNIH